MMKGFAWFILSLLLACILMPIGIIYAMLRPGRSAYFIELAEQINRTGNVVCCKLFNQVLISNQGYQFGHPWEWISSAIGKNKQAGTLSKCGRATDRILEFIQKDHSIRNIQTFNMKQLLPFLIMLLLMSCNNQPERKPETKKADTALAASAPAAAPTQYATTAQLSRATADITTLKNQLGTAQLTIAALSKSDNRQGIDIASGKSSINFLATQVQDVLNKIAALPKASQDSLITLVQEVKTTGISYQYQLNDHNTRLYQLKFNDSAKNVLLNYTTAKARQTESDLVSLKTLVDSSTVYPDALQFKRVGNILQVTQWQQVVDALKKLGVAL